MTDENKPAVFQLRHSVLRNTLYHIARKQYLDGVNRAFNFIIVISGTGTVYQVTTSNPQLAAWLGVAVTIIASAQLVFDFNGRARNHDLLQRRYHHLLAEIEKETKPTHELCAAWHSEQTAIYADEPPTMRALDAIADNQATANLIGAQQPRLKITRWQSATRYILAHNGATFPINT